MSIIDKITFRDKRTKEILEAANVDLQELVNHYFNNYENLKDKYDRINLEWKKRVHQINSTQKIIKLRSDSFEVEVARIISENPQFQEVKDLTKI